MILRLNKAIKQFKKNKLSLKMQNYVTLELKVYQK